MTNQERAAKIRLMTTAIVIAEYALIGLKDNTKQDLKQRVNGAILACRKVQSWFTYNPNARPEISLVFKEQFLGGEIVLLSDLLELCFGMTEDGLEEIIKAIKQNTDEQQISAT